jgi:kynureninase
VTAYRVGELPEGALEAAARFHSEHVAPIRAALAQPQVAALVIVFAPAPVDHRGWRLAAVQDLARSAAPVRVNAVAGDDEQAIAQALAYLEAAPGITGQLFAVDGKSVETR